MICALTLLVGFKLPLNKEDKKAVDDIRSGCARQYPEYPCLIELLKTPRGTYQAICGPVSIEGKF